MAALLILVGALLISLLEFFSAARSGSWQLVLGGSATFLLTLEAILALRFSRLDRDAIGLVILLLTGPLVFILHAALISGISVALALGVLLILVSGPPVLVSGRHSGWFIFLGIVSSLLVLIIDSQNSAWRIPSPPYLQNLILAVVGAIVLLNILFLLRQFGNLALKTKLLLVIVAVITVSTAAVAYLSVTRSREALLDLSRQNLTTSAASAADDVVDYLESNLATLEREAQLPVFGEYLAAVPEERSPIKLAEVAAMLNTLASQDIHADVTVTSQDFSQSYLLLDREGNLIASTVPEISTYFYGKEYFKRAVSLDHAVVSAIQVTGTQQASIYFAAPVKRYDHLVGVLVLRTDALVLQSLVKASNDDAGKGSYGILVNEQHIRLAQGNTSSLLYTTIVPLAMLYATGLQADGLLPPGDSELFTTNIPGLETGLLEAGRYPDFAYVDPTGGERYLATTLTISPTGLQPSSWQLAYVQPEASLLAPVEAQGRWIEILALAIAGFAALLANALARGLVSPIQHLDTAVQKVINGDLSARTAVTTDDEVGHLAQSFNQMTDRIQELVANLEQRVSERTAELERRSRYLEGSVEVGRAATSLLDPQELLAASVNLIQKHFGLYYVGLFLTDEQEQWAVLRAGTGTAGEAMLRRRHRLSVDETSMIGWCICNSRARVALDVSEDRVRLATAELPETRSEAAIPLRSRGRLIGAISVQSTQPNVFDNQVLAVLQTMSDQLAVALDNARLYSASQESLETARRASTAATRTAWLELLANTGSTGFVSSEQGVLPAGAAWEPEALAAFQRGEVIVGDHSNASQPGEAKSPTRREALSVPIKVRGQVVGVLDTYKSAQGGRWDQEEISLMENMAEQLSLALDSARLYQETQQQAERDRLVTEITGRMRETLEIDSVLKTAIQEIYQALSLHDVSVRLEKKE